MPKQWSGGIALTPDEFEAEQRAYVAEIVERGIRTGVEFKLARKLTELSQTQLAELLGITLESVSRWETGKHEIPRAVAYALGQLFLHPKAARRRLEAAAQPVAAKAGY